MQTTAAAGLAAATPWALAQEPRWPQRPVRFVVPFAPGGGADMATRLMAERLRPLWNNASIVIENKPGANTIIAIDTMLNAPRDGYTFVATISLSMFLPDLLKKVPFNPAVDLVPVATITTEQLVLVAPANSQVRSLPELIEAARREPNRFAFGSYGIGSTSHLLQIELNHAAGGHLVHVPYKGTAPAVQAVLGGEVGVVLSNLGTIKQHLAAGKLVALAVTGDRRSRFLPEVPTLSELGFKGFEVPAWIGVFAASGVPAPILQKLGTDIQAALKSPELTARFNDFGQEPGNLSTPEFQAMIRRDVENGGRMIRAAGVRLE